MAKYIDLTDRQFGRVTVVKRVGSVSYPCGQTQAQFLCKCECGKEFLALGCNLRNGNTKSCGCLKREARSWLRKGK